MGSVGGAPAIRVAVGEELAVFKRKKDRDGGAAQPAEAAGPTTAGPAAVDGAEPAGDPLDEAAFVALVDSVPPGPYDASSVPVINVNRIDLGSMQIAGFSDMQLHFETDPSQQRFVSVVAQYQDAALRLQPLAAPRSGGQWDEMRPTIIASIKSVGGDAEEVEGSFGTEVHGIVPAVLPDGEQVRQPVRLIGVERPRWMLHGVFMGSAAMDEAKAELLEDVFRQTVVVRGEQPMAPGEVIPITLPPGAQESMAQQQAAQEGQQPGPGTLEA